MKVGSGGVFNKCLESYQQVFLYFLVQWGCCFFCNNASFNRPFFYDLVISNPHGSAGSNILYQCSSKSPFSNPSWWLLSNTFLKHYVYHFNPLCKSHHYIPNPKWLYLVFRVWHSMSYMIMTYTFLIQSVIYPLWDLRF